MIGIHSNRIRLIAVIIAVCLGGCRQADPPVGDPREGLMVLRQAVLAYHKDTGVYPDEIRRLFALSAESPVAGWNGPYLTEAQLNDPWGRPYQYGVMDEILFVGTVGPNGRPETTDENLRDRLNGGDDIVLIMAKEHP
jgi:Type II secretion system (T2SS), protein G